MTLKYIPKISLMATLSVILLSSCMESDEERLAREKATQDSIAAVSRKEEKSFEDSMVNVAKSPQQEKEDSTAAPLDGSGNPGVK